MIPFSVQQAFPLDQVSANIGAAFGLRVLTRNALQKPLIRVRRSSDNVERDIYYNPAFELDTTDLLSFVGANSAYVTIWYDQGANGLNAAQPTAAAQPRIVNAGTLDTRNGKPTIISADPARMYVTVSNLTMNYASVVGGVSTFNTGAYNNFVRNNVTSGAEWALRTSNSSPQKYEFYKLPVASTLTANASANTLLIFEGVGQLDGVNKIFVNGSVVTTGTVMPTTSTSGNLFLGSNGSTEYLNGFLSEIFISDSQPSLANLKVLQTNRSLYYGIQVSV